MVEALHSIPREVHLGPATSRAGSFSHHSLETNSEKSLEQNRNAYWLSVGDTLQLPMVVKSSGEQGKVSTLRGGRHHVQITVEDMGTNYGSSSLGG